MEPRIVRELLEQRRRDLEQVIRTATEQGALDEEQSTAGDHSAFDSADAATDTLERELGLSVRDTAVASLQDVERALEGLENGTYGICPVCGEPIPTHGSKPAPRPTSVEHQPSAARLRR